MNTTLQRTVISATLCTVSMIAGCAGSAHHPSAHVAVAARFAPAVQVGEMRPVMREGQTQPRVKLARANDQPHLFAVGAVAGLDGEITIADGQVWVSRVVDGRPATFGPKPRHDASATLLVGFRVEQWDAVTLEESLAPEALDAAIEHAARAHGIDTAAPFPFRLEGEFTSLDMHVVNGFCPHSGGEAEAAHQPWKSAFVAPVQARVVGIFAKGAEGVLTHHGTAIHAHAIVNTPEGLVTGHIDTMGAAKGTVLLLPAAR